AAHVRPGSRSSEKWAGQFRAWGAEVVEAPWEPDALRAALAAHEPDLVFSCIGVTRASAKRDQIGDGANIYQEVDVRLNGMLLDAVTATGLTPRFIYLSSV